MIMKTTIVVLTVAAPIVTADALMEQDVIFVAIRIATALVLPIIVSIAAVSLAVVHASMSLTLALTAVVASVGDNARQPGAVTAAVIIVTVRAVIVVTVAVLTATVRAVPLRLVLIAVLTIVQGNATILLQLSAPVVINRNVCAAGARNVAR